MTTSASSYITNHYALSTWFNLAQGDEALLVRILSDTAGLKGWLSRPLHDQLSKALLADVAEADVLDSFDRAAVYLLSQMPQFNGPENETDWQQWLTQWQIIHKDKTPAEQLDALPERFNHPQAEKVMKILLASQKSKVIPLTHKD
ncbi:hypothetical protein ABMA58_10555 [Oceanospirillum sp. HFRX-1_2]